MSTGLAVTSFAITSTGKRWSDENGTAPVDLTMLTVSQGSQSVQIPVAAGDMVAQAMRAKGGTISVQQPSAITITVAGTDPVTISSSSGGSVSFPASEVTRAANLIQVHCRIGMGQAAYIGSDGNVHT